MATLVNVLMLSRVTSWHGGVVDLVAMWKQSFSPDIKVIDFKIGDRRERRTRLRRYLQPMIDAARLFMEVRKKSYDIVHINPSLNINSLLRDGLFMLVLRLSRQPVLVFFHGWDGKLSQRIRHSRVLSFFMRMAFGKSSCILVLSDNFRQQLVQMGIDTVKIEVITTMFDGKQLISLHSSRIVGTRNILFLSRFVREKGVFELIEAFARIVKEFPDAHLTMAGDGPAYDEIIQAVRATALDDKVSFPGYVRDAEKVAVLSSADIFVLPSYSEGCPISMLEAMAAGLVLVSTSVGGIPDILKDGLNGVLLETAHPNLIYNALYKLMSSPELVRKISEKNKETSWRCYEASVVTAKIENYYRKALT